MVLRALSAQRSGRLTLNGMTAVVHDVWRRLAYLAAEGVRRKWMRSVS